MRPSASNMMAATVASDARKAKNIACDIELHRVPTAPADRLPVKIAKNQAATVVAAKRGGASRAKRPNPVGRMCNSPMVKMTKKRTSQRPLARCSPAWAATPARSA